ncbi:hypothetical protein ACFX13_030390 [Malus domestica]
MAENGKFEQNPEMNSNSLSRIDLLDLNEEAPFEGIEINHLSIIPYGEIRDIQDSQQLQFEGQVVQNFEIETQERVYETVAIGPSPNARVGGTVQKIQSGKR